MKSLPVSVGLGAILLKVQTGARPATAGSAPLEHLAPVGVGKQNAFVLIPKLD